MDHVVYVDAAARELALLLSGTKTMVIRGAAGRKLPYGRVAAGDMLYFIQNNSEGFIRACARVRAVTNTNRMEEEVSKAPVEQNQPKLQLSPKQMERWAGKKYLVLIEVEQVQELAPFAIDKSAYGTMDDWLPVEKIETVRLTKPE